MLKFILRIVANVIFPAIAGYVVTLHLLLPLAMTWLPGFRPEALLVVPLTGLITTLLCLLPRGARRLVAQRAD